MEQILELENIQRGNTTNVLEQGIVIENKRDMVIEHNKKEFAKVLEDTIYKGADYVIKGLPISTCVKDVLIDVKNAFRTKDFKEILKTAVNSSIREGLEILSIPKNVIRDITKIKDIALSGGIKNAVTAGIDIVTGKYLKGNIFEPFIKEFLNKTKDFVFSHDFIRKIDSGIKKVLVKGDQCKKLCEDWYRAYDQFDLEQINYLAKEIKSKKKYMCADANYMKESSIIDNMTKLINAKKEKLSQIQLQICHSL